MLVHQVQYLNYVSVAITTMIDFKISFTLFSAMEQNYHNFNPFFLFFFFTWRKPPLVGQGLLSIETSRSHSDAPHSVGLLWTSDQPVAETSTWQHTTLTRDRHPCPRRDSNSHSQQASGRRPTPQKAQIQSTAAKTRQLPLMSLLFDSKQDAVWMNWISLAELRSGMGSPLRGRG